jgi:hypothetical protein
MTHLLLPLTLTCLNKEKVFHLDPENYIAIFHVLRHLPERSVPEQNPGGLCLPVNALNRIIRIISRFPKQRIV